MLPIQKAQFIAQCRTYFEIHEQLKRQLQQAAFSYHNYQDDQFDFNVWAHQCCQYQYDLLSQRPFVYGANPSFANYETVSLLTSNDENQASQVCLAHLNTTLDPYDRAKSEHQPSRSSENSNTKVQNIEEPIVNTLENTNDGDVEFFKSDDEDSDQLVVDTDYESDANDKALNFTLIVKILCDTMKVFSFSDLNTDNLSERFSDTDFRYVFIKKRKYFCCPSLRLGLAKHYPMSKEVIEAKIDDLDKFCLTHMEDSYKIHKYRLRGLEVLSELCNRSVLLDLRSVQIVRLVWSSISCVHHFYVRLKINKGFFNWMKKRQAKKAMDVYEKVLHFCILPKSCDVIVRAVVTFFTASNMWHVEYLSTHLIKQLLMVSTEGAATIHIILDVVESTSVKNMFESRQILRILYQVLETYTWHDMDDLLMQRLLTMFYKSVVPTDSVFDYVPLQKGIELTLRYVLQNVSSDSLLKAIKFMIDWLLVEYSSEQALLNFGNIIEYSASLYETYLYRDSLYPNLFPTVLQLVSSENRLYSLLGNRILQSLFDRHHNVSEFDTPKIFFANMPFHIVIGHYNSEDKAFIRTYRELIHSTFLKAIQLHAAYRINLESTYTSIAVLVVEIPCGYTAAAVVCLAMAIQDSAIANVGLEQQCLHRLHALVASIISLVCWVHNAQIFYDYVQQIVEKRAKFAPHLNPPMRSTYQYAQHHVLWNKPELFFEHWEARYGLWKCFRTKRARASTLISTKNLLISTLKM